MNAAILAPFAVALVPHLVDETPGHNHFAARQFPHEAAVAFAQACTELEPFPTDTDGTMCVTFLVVMSGLETAFGLATLGDCRDRNPDHLAADGREVCDEEHRPRARGPFQEHTGSIADRTESWLRSTRHFLRFTVPTAIAACPREMIAPLAGERCGASRHHRQRWSQIAALLSEVTP